MPFAQTTRDAAITTSWLVDAEALVRELGSDVRLGLTGADAAGRVEQYGRNELDSHPPIAPWRKLVRQFQDALVYLLVGATVASVASWIVDGANGLPVEALVIGGIVIANGVLGFVQERRAEQAVDSLKRAAAPVATVVRDGSLATVPSVGVVPGDILVLEEGNSVVADCRLLEVSSLRVSEASLTGESEPSEKDAATLTGEVALGDRNNMVFGGTAVTSGRGRAIVVATGMQTEIGRIARLLDETVEQPTPLQREVRQIGRFLARVVVLIAAVVVATILVMSEIDSVGDVVDVLIVGISLAVAAVPEGLPAVLSVVLALGVQRMARENAIVKKLSAVESLGSVSVICSDKTGTLTRNEMTATTVVTASGVVTLSGVGYRPEGHAMVDGRVLKGAGSDAALLGEVLAVLGGGSLANNAVLQEVAGEWVVRGDPTDGAFLVAEAKLGISEAREARFERVAEAPFTSERKLMSTVHTDGRRGDLLVAVAKGAPDVLLARCTSERVADAVIPLTEARHAEILASIDWLAGQALRPLGVAYREFAADDQASDAGPPDGREHGMTFLGMVGIFDPPRAEAVDSIARAHSAGIRVLMITGDHPRTALRIATDLGLAEDTSRVVSGPEIEAMDHEQLREAVREVSVYARVAPEDKLRIVAALQANGDIAAMTGDGVNDAPALRAADIGIAMGIAGTDIARESADMILADDNFATIVTAVEEGRGIVDNIRAFLRFLLSSNAGEVLTMFLGVVGARMLGLDETGEAIAVPLLATQILWINLLTDTAPALALGIDPPSGNVMRRPPRAVSERIIDREMQGGIVFIGVVMAVVTLLALDLRLPGGFVGGTGNIELARTMAFTTLVLGQLFNCFNARSERDSAFSRLFTNRLLWLAIAVSLTLQIAVVHVAPFRSAFSTTPLSAEDWLLCAGLASVVLWASELRKLLLRRSSAGQ